MVDTIQDFIQVGRRNRPGYRMAPEYVTIHDTANTHIGAGARAHAAYIKGDIAAARPASWHFTVDDGVIYQHLPLDENGWHAGDGTNGIGNRKSVGIEICENRDGNRAKAEDNAAWLTAKLLKNLGLGIERVRQGVVKQHYDWNKKNCPRVIRSRVDGWLNFLRRVQSHLDKMAVQAPSGPLPKITRKVGVVVDGRMTDIPGYLIDNTTFVPAARVAKVTGHGDHIKITT